MAAEDARSVKKSAGAFRTISEVADELDLPQHVLRFWETKFPQIRPMKRGGGRRYYRPEDILLLSRIRGWLYDDGYTIKGVQKLLKDGVTDEPGAPPATEPDPAADDGQAVRLAAILAELKDIRALLN
ncbi:MAG: MerR family transcriptional regulator [Rhodospirillales bacterium CG15_BIG_FIL_POST_REV_8_21_14_020_66_15]|nr:MAG: MerR family transcriptional regulator [Rhodospirillales bacterium CG15_BIG_FIL_POST_REV_8_21_14_020_66_15]